MRITNVRRNSSGIITDVKMNTGTEMSINEAISLAKDGEIESVIVGKTRHGSETLRSSPNNTPDDNLDNLPTF